MKGDEVINASEECPNSFSLFNICWNNERHLSEWTSCDLVDCGSKVLVDFNGELLSVQHRIGEIWCLRANPSHKCTNDGIVHLALNLAMFTNQILRSIPNDNDNIAFLHIWRINNIMWNVDIIRINNLTIFDIWRT